MEVKKTEITEYDQHLADSQSRFLMIMDKAGLPTKNIFVEIPERVKVFSNAESLLVHLNDDVKIDAVYVSKFFAAVAAGLFDAALNYIWDETILHLRRRIEMYDLEYFYDIAASTEKRKQLKTFDDISKLTDDELLKGAFEIELISESGYRNIDLVRYMRNNASAAHPNHLDISGLKLIAMAEDCLREVISTPIPPKAIEVKRLLANVKTDTMSETDAIDVSAHFPEMGKDRAQNLAKGLFSIFCDRELSEDVRQNIRLLAPLLWPYADEDTRRHFGVRHANFSANSNLSEKKLAREFLSIVEGLSYISDEQRVVELMAVVEELEAAHGGFNNFYTETLPAKRLLSIIGKPSSIPKGAEPKYIKALVSVFLTNGNGVANAADEYYVQLLSGLNPRQSIYALTLIFDESISSKLRLTLCQNKFFELLTILKKKISTHAAKQLIAEIESKRYQLSDVRKQDALRDLANTAISEIK
jgi:hypothetical protein